ncbi:DNA-binding protein SMUBP-2 [Amphibalanus amphitrite]|uniref:DNA-binding protein SMUBP-2 n=1 Tax=Amphibalanus amphitrite TaxID=1232801 RepID=A0A6A4VN54_AMPAM|nr:DNA-binding protein SMUBP-2 [Amphibalanus amphitrite]
MTDSQPDGPSGGTKKSPSSPLTCEELQQLHLLLLGLDHDAVLHRQRELAEFGQLEGLLVEGTVLTPKGLRLWVLGPGGGTEDGSVAAAVEERMLPKHNIRAREPVERDAVEFAVRQKHLAVIHGPPGTGKTATIVEIILQHLKSGCRILACAHSNTAVDNMLERLSEKNSLHDLGLSMSMEAACWLAAQRTGKLLLTGDHRQLPPIVFSPPAAQCGLEVSLMERQVELHGEKAVRMLCTQYRMHELIQQWPSQQHYNDRLEAAPAVRDHRLTDLPGVRLTEDTEHTLVLIDTAGYGLTEARPDYSGSRSNHGEAEIVAAHVNALVWAGVSQDQIGVITPYRAQSTRVRGELLWDGLNKVDVQTVDGFQGARKGGHRRNVGHLQEARPRIRYRQASHQRAAITRARRQLVIICDTKLMSQDDDLQSLLEYMRENGKVWTANDYADDLSPEVRARLLASQGRHRKHRDSRHPDQPKTNKKAPPKRGTKKT